MNDNFFLKKKLTVEILKHQSVALSLIVTTGSFAISFIIDRLNNSYRFVKKSVCIWKQ